MSSVILIWKLNRNGLLSFYSKVQILWIAHHDLSTLNLNKNLKIEPEKQTFPGLQHTWLTVSKNHEPLWHNNSNFQTRRGTRGWAVMHFENFLFFFKPWNDSTLKNCFIKIIKLVECDYEHKNVKVPFPRVSHTSITASILNWVVPSLL